MTLRTPPKREYPLTPEARTLAILLRQTERARLLYQARLSRLKGAVSQACRPARR